MPRTIDSDCESLPPYPGRVSSLPDDDDDDDNGNTVTGQHRIAVDPSAETDPQAPPPAYSPRPNQSETPVYPDRERRPYTAYTPQRRHQRQSSSPSVSSPSQQQQQRVSQEQAIPERQPRPYANTPHQFNIDDHNWESRWESQHRYDPPPTTTSQRQQRHDPSVNANTGVDPVVAEMENMPSQKRLYFGLDLILRCLGVLVTLPTAGLAAYVIGTEGGSLRGPAILVLVTGVYACILDIWLASRNKKHMSMGSIFIVYTLPFDLVCLALAAGAMAWYRDMIGDGLGSSIGAWGISITTVCILAIRCLLTAGGLALASYRSCRPRYSAVI